MSDAIQSAYELLESSIIHYLGGPVGTVASLDPEAPAPNYADCFVRDFVPSALVFLLDGRPEIVRNFLKLTLKIRDMQEEIAGHRMLPRVMPASFKVIQHPDGREGLEPDFGDRAIGRVAPVDSMMWWVLITQAYTSMTGDEDFARGSEMQRGLRTIVNILLRDRFEVFPTLLVPDGSFMIDRRMGVNGHPLEIQSLFFGTLAAARRLLDPAVPENQPLIEDAGKRLSVLTDYVHQYYWLNFERLNEIHRYHTELFGEESANALNIHPESIPSWVLEWLPEDAGYLVGNLGPGRMDFRFFSFGNLLAVMFGLATAAQSERILQVFAGRWDDLIGMMPVKICYPAMEGLEWQLMTGSDPKNIPWSYHNGGNWPTLLWAFVGAALTAGRGDLAERAHAVAERRLPGNRWPEYYDGRNGRLIGRRANFHQIWSAAALIVSRHLLDDPACLARFGWYVTEPLITTPSDGGARATGISA